MSEHQAPTSTGGLGPLPNAVTPGGPSLDEIASQVGDDGDKLKARRRWFARSSPLLPEAGATGAPMTAVIAVISALAALALAAFVVITIAADNWTDDLASSMTVQVKGADEAEITARTEAAMAVLGGVPGISDLKTTPPKDAAKLLEPWLGEGADEYLSVPALIEMRATPEVRAALPALRAKLSGAADGLSLDDHGGWNASLASAARSGQALAFGIFALITLAACAVAAFAARAGLSANADVVSLLHLVGATDDFIASEVQRRFLLVGLRGSLLGVVIALASVAIAAFAARTGGALGYLLPSFSIDPLVLIPMAIVPLAICLATAITARLTVLDVLKKDL